jgi:ribosomal protein S18 acetylase RimI-like enzyme
MAVLEHHRKKGFGKALMVYCENQCNKQRVDLIWFNARTEASKFYEKIGYTKTGIPFEIPSVGMHIVMFKKK